jgi:hypothetical protein
LGSTVGLISPVYDAIAVFCNHRQLVERIKFMLGDAGIIITEMSETDSSSQCPECGSDTVQRRGDEYNLKPHTEVPRA